MDRFEVCVTDSLEKILPGMQPHPLAENILRAWPGETVSFQVAARRTDGDGHKVRPVLSAAGPGADGLRVRAEQLMPVLLAASVGADDSYLAKTAAMLPDALLPLEDGEPAAFRCVGTQWDAFWCDRCVAPDTQPGDYPLQIVVTAGQEIFRRELILRVEADPLPEQTVLHTEWFHADCLADYYHTEPWSEEHWRIVERFVSAARDCGVNMLLTPLLTPALDTEVGAERTTCQLLQVFAENDAYRFDFSRLDRWIAMCLRHGIHEIELSHLFTQWGAQAAPKVIAEQNGHPVRIFGWDTPAVGGAYTRFLRCLLPELKEHLRGLGMLEHTWFHISDEPNRGNLEQWKAARDSVADLLEGCHVIDALSEIDFYRQGLIRTPVVAENRLEPFVSEHVQGLWTYYCCSQIRDVPNRFIAMPSARSRILGTLLYCYDLTGFLHWGFNFYNSERSHRRIDPWQTADGCGSWPAGDPFLVYPGSDGTPVGSVRSMVLREAFQDHRLLCLAEQKLGRAHVMQLLRDSWEGGEMTMTHYPCDARWFAGLRAALADALRPLQHGK